jgi:8-oxo-dGTP pyrophosphatase MutT (NUDIX family)
MQPKKVIWNVKIKGDPHNWHGVVDMVDLGGGDKGNNYILTDGRQVHQTLIDDIDFEPNKKLEKDVGRITFPKIDPKLTRPDQEVGDFGPSTSRLIVNKISNFLGGMSDFEKDMFELSYNSSINKPDKNTGMTYATGGNPVGAYKKKEADNFVKEHEGLHHLVNHLSTKLNVPNEQIYNKLNSHIGDETKATLRRALDFHRNYKDEGVANSEYTTALRDALVNKDWRDKVLFFTPQDKRQAAHTRMKNEFRAARNWAKNAVASDFADPIKKSFDKLCKKYNVTINYTKDKALKKSIEQMERIACVVVMKGDQILMGKRKDSGKFTFPGGHIDAGEDPKAGAIRELREESGIVAEDLDYLGEQIKVGQDGKIRKIYVFCLLGDKPLVTNKFDPDGEFSKMYWVNVKNGLPEQVKNNLHVPKPSNLALELLGL